MVSSKELLSPGPQSGGGAQAYVFDRTTFQRMSVADLSPEGRYILGVRRAGEVYWETNFDPEAERLWLVPWTPPKRPASKPATTVLRGDFDGSGRVDQTDVIFLFAWLAAQVEFPNTPNGGR